MNDNGVWDKGVHLGQKEGNGNIVKPMPIDRSVQMDSMEGWESSCFLSNSIGKLRPG